VPKHARVAWRATGCRRHTLRSASIDRARVRVPAAQFSSRVMWQATSALGGLLGKPLASTSAPAPGADVRFWEAPEREGWLLKQCVHPTDSPTRRCHTAR
jgi:hypothetical protein